MSFFDSLNTSATGLTAQSLRMDIISQNMTNIDTTRTAEGGPYKRKTVIFKEISNDKNTFRHMFNTALNNNANNDSISGVKVDRIAVDNTEGIKEYNPNHPDADENGYVEKPNVNVVEEMVNMISANRAYEANITAINITKSMINRTLEIGK
ncbi:flagellar basal body rod protein FlgC [uncultured Tyzzerella sp.]|uniref:flagellar basal body rod protein FlgC n=1 Tax=uncultured Tyzzerella sp. TaxID=2321398 RepID=UPI0029439494|nr:flagellar basal body rod protein FlgC [uncultured Tyzzerella sp.]